MKPTLQDVRYDPILSNISVRYSNDTYIAEQILPVLQVGTRTGKYYKIAKDNFRIDHSFRAMGTAAREVGYDVSQSTAYVVDEHSLVQPVPDELKQQALRPLSPEVDATLNITDKILVEKEYGLAAYMQSTTNLTNNTTLAGVNQWSDYANSSPLTDIRTGITTIHGKIFKKPNVVVLGKEVYDKLLDHPDIVDRIKYSALGVATTDLMARLFGVEKVIVGGAGRNTATEGQTDSLSYVWGKYAWVLYVSPTPTINSVSFGYHFTHKPRMVDKWYDKVRKSTMVRVTDNYTKEIITVDAAYLIKNAIA